MGIVERISQIFRTNYDKNDGDHPGVPERLLSSAICAGASETSRNEMTRSRGADETLGTLYFSRACSARLWVRSVRIHERKIDRGR